MLYANDMIPGGHPVNSRFPRRTYVVFVPRRGALPRTYSSVLRNRSLLHQELVLCLKQDQLWNGQSRIVRRLACLYYHRFSTVLSTAKMSTRVASTDEAALHHEAEWQQVCTSFFFLDFQIAAAMLLGGCWSGTAAPCRKNATSVPRFWELPSAALQCTCTWSIAQFGKFGTFLVQYTISTCAPIRAMRGLALFFGRTLLLFSLRSG
jgi:hypothetical protein